MTITKTHNISKIAKSKKPDNSKPSYIVKHYDSKKNRTSQVGPFHNEKEATDTVKHFLKRGTCSWLVTYNG